MATHWNSLSLVNLLDRIFSSQDETQENIILLNPRLQPADYQSLRTLAERVQLERKLQGHIWIATSGSTADSTGSTKLVALSKAALISSAAAVNQFLNITAQDIWAQVLPHFHVGGLGIEIRARLSQSKVVSAQSELKWDPHYFYQILKEHQCTLSALVPTQVYDLVALNLVAPPTLRAIVVGGGGMDVHLFKRARELGWPVLPSYGMTETSSQIATASLRSLTVESQELLNDPKIEVLPHVEVQLNTEGFIQIRGTCLLSCYAQRTEEGIRHWDPKIEGWFTTEDRGEIYCDHQYEQTRHVLKILGRSKDYIKIGGEGCNLAHLRNQLEQIALSIHPSWPAQLCILDMPSERLGAEIHLVTTLDSDNAEKIIKIFSEKVMPYEKIRKVHFIDEIPRTELGKIQWNNLRRKL